MPGAEEPRAMPCAEDPCASDGGWNASDSWSVRGQTGQVYAASISSSPPANTNVSLLQAYNMVDVPAASDATDVTPDRQRRWLGIAALAILLVSALTADQIIRSGYFTIEKVTVANPLTHVDRGIVERTAWRSIQGNLLNVDLNRIEESLETLPGVFQVLSLIHI